MTLLMRMVQLVQHQSSVSRRHAVTSRGLYLLNLL